MYSYQERVDMNKERLYPEIEKVEKILEGFTPGQPSEAAIGAFGGLLYTFEQERELTPKGKEVLDRVRGNFEVLFRTGKFEKDGGWKNVVHALNCDMARLKMLVSMHAEKK
jgi:hypothetical protein